MELFRVGAVSLNKWKEGRLGKKNKTHYYIHTECENCPLSWEDCDYWGECNDYGCYINHDFKVPLIICLLPYWAKELIKKWKGWEE